MNGGSQYAGPADPVYEVLLTTIMLFLRPILHTEASANRGQE